MVGSPAPIERDRVVLWGGRGKGRGRENESFNCFFIVEALRARAIKILNV